MAKRPPQNFDSGIMLVCPRCHVPNHAGSLECWNCHSDLDVGMIEGPIESEAPRAAETDSEGGNLATYLWLVLAIAIVLGVLALMRVAVGILFRAALIAAVIMLFLAVQRSWPRKKT